MGKTAEEIAAAEAAQEAAAEAAAEETATEGKEGAEEGDENTEGEAKPEVKVEPAASDPALKEVLDQIRERLTPQMTPAEREAQIKALETETGFNRKQLAFMAKQNEQTKLNASLQYLKDSGKAKVSTILGKMSDKLTAQVEAEMAKLDPRVQADPAAWENMAYLVKGKNAEAYAKGDDAEDTEEQPKKTIGGGMQGLTGVKKGGTVSKGAKKQYDADETTMIERYFSGDAAAYEASKAEKRVGLPRKGEEQKNLSSADRELARMTGGQVG